MTVCTWFLRGLCKFGDRCKNEHPINVKDGGFNRSGGFGQQAASNDVKVGFTADSIKEDLARRGRPLWKLSSYGPMMHEPTLICGLDLSPEEVRLRATIDRQTGKFHEYTKWEDEKINDAEVQFVSGMRNKEELFTKGKRQSIMANQPSGGMTTEPQVSNPPNPFGASSGIFGAKPQVQSTFGQPSAFGQMATPSALAPRTAATTSVFGGATTTAAPTSVFGTSATPAVSSAFAPRPATTSAFGQSGFGQPTTLGGATSSVIKPATAGAFGAFANSGPSAFAQAAQSQPAASSSAGGAFSSFAGSAPSAFAAAAAAKPTTTGGSVFGQPSAFGNASAQSGSVFGGGGSVFGAPAASATADPNPLGSNPLASTGGGFSAFAGAPSAFGAQQAPPATTSVFGAQQPPPSQSISAFAQSQPSTTPSAFGSQPQSTSVFGQSQAPTSVFGQMLQAKPQPTSVFGQSQQSTPSAFGQPQQPTTSVFGQPQQPTSSVFGQSQQPTQSPFGQSQPGSQPSVEPAPTSAFGNLNSNAFGAALPQPTTQLPSKPTEIKAEALDFNSAVYNYRPGLVLQDAMLPPQYIELLPDSAKNAFAAAKFEWGKIPEWVPPVEMRPRTLQATALFS